MGKQKAKKQGFWPWEEVKINPKKRVIRDGYVIDPHWKTATILNPALPDGCPICGRFKGKTYSTLRTVLCQINPKIHQRWDKSIQSKKELLSKILQTDFICIECLRPLRIVNDIVESYDKNRFYNLMMEDDEPYYENALGILQRGEIRQIAKYGEIKYPAETFLEWLYYMDKDFIC